MASEEKSVDLIFKNTHTGEVTNFGVILDRGTVGAWKTWLTFSVEQDMFWVIAQNPNNIKITSGYRASRRADAEEHFRDQTESELDEEERATRSN